MYIIVDKDTNIVISVDNTHSKAVSSLQNFMEESSYEVTPSIGQKFIKDTNTFKDLTPAEIRETRNKILKNTDWRATVDYPNADQAAWKTYRQQLRDLPQDYPDMVGLVFPVEPNADQ